MGAESTGSLEIESLRAKSLGTESQGNEPQMANEMKKSISGKPIPEGVVEIKGISATGGIVALKDGSWLLAQEESCRTSTDEDDLAAPADEILDLTSPVGNLDLRQRQDASFPNFPYRLDLFRPVRDDIDHGECIHVAPIQAGEEDGDLREPARGKGSGPPSGQPRPRC